MRFVVMAMPGAGNFGDDLISVYLVHELLAQKETTSITVLHFSFLVKGLYPENERLRFVTLPWVKEPSKYLGNSVKVSSAIRLSDHILVGGGGLLQDVHRPLTPYLFTRFAFSIAGVSKPASFVGLGVGPISRGINRWYLTVLERRFQHFQVRDFDSLSFLSPSIGGKTSIAPDIVAGTSWFSEVLKRQESKEGVLGCSIREWTDLRTDEVVRLITNVCQEKKLTCRLFVFEYQPWSVSEFSYAKELMESLVEQGVETELLTYGRDEVGVFLDGFTSVSCAIASRYHANILWQRLGIPVLPLAYASKVRSLYEERGEAVVSHPEVGAVAMNPQSWCFSSLPLNEEKYHLPDFCEANPPNLLSRFSFVFIGIFLSGLNLVSFIVRRIRK